MSEIEDRIDDKMRADLRTALISNLCTSPDGTMIHAPTQKVIDLAVHVAMNLPTIPVLRFGEEKEA
jgi:hypothetical protein